MMTCSSRCCSGQDMVVGAFHAVFTSDHCASGHSFFAIPQESVPMVVRMTDGKLSEHCDATTTIHNDDSNTCLV